MLYILYTNVTYLSPQWHIATPLLGIEPERRELLHSGKQESSYISPVRGKRRNFELIQDWSLIEDQRTEEPGTTGADTGV